ncbi:MAG: SDR family oxidoreductase [Pseudomonadota bacterium]
MDYKNKWALITGASAGIGEVFAKAYAARGANIVVTARRADRLNALCNALEADFGVKTVAVPADLSEPSAPDRIMQDVADRDIEIDILVNNAGFGLPGHYVENEWEAHRDFIALMMTSYAHLARLAVPGMLARRCGQIIHVASLAGLIPGSAGHTLYGASKAFLVSFAQSLAAECEGSGVTVSALCPGFTYSEFHDVNETRDVVSQLPDYMFMKAEPVVEGAIAAVERGHVVYVPGAWNKFIAWLMKALPRPWAAAMVKRQSSRFRRRVGENSLD